MLKGQRAEFAKTTWVCRGGYRIFQKGGLRPAIRNTGGGGAVHLWPDTKSVRVERGGGGGGGRPLKARYEKRGGWGGGGCCPALQARYKIRGGGGGAV